MALQRSAAAASCGIMLALTAACSEKPPTAATCTFQVVTSQHAFGPAGGTGKAAVTTGSSCAWSAASQADWIQVATDSRQGSGEISFTVQPSPQPQPREGSIRVAGETLSVSQQNCRATLTPAEITLPAEGGSVAVGIDTEPACRWKIDAAPSWASIEPAEGSGSATVTVKAVPQTETSGREATISILSAQLLLRQGRAAECTYALSGEPASLTPAGGVVTLRLGTGPTCRWTIGTPESWLRFIDAPTGNGPATIRVAVEGNPEAPARQARVQAMSASVTFSQAGQSGCAYRVTPVLRYVGTSGGSGTVTVTTGEGCAWTASPAQSWIKVDRRSGQGSGQVSFTADRNPEDYVTDFRKAPVEIRWLAPTGGENAWLWQFGDCRTAFAVAPNPPFTGYSNGTVSFGANGGEAHLLVLVESTFNCPWTIELPPNPWFTTSRPVAPEWHKGDGDLHIVVPANPSSQPRTAVLVVGEKPITVTQAGRQ